MSFVNEQLEHNQEVLQRARDMHRAARASRFEFDLNKTMALLRKRIIGQDHVLDDVERALITIKGDFLEKNKPLVVSFFLGPTGVGKTETVRVLAEALHGDPQKMCRIDMNTLAQNHYSAALTGSPPGYVGSKEGQTLFDVEAVKGSYSRPGIVLFDEIEKADRDVIRAIMNIFDTGKLSLSAGSGVIDFSNAMIFMTSNLGVKEYNESLAKYQSGWRRAIGLNLKNKNAILQEALYKHFDLEFLNRIDYTHIFTHLDSSRQKSIIALELEKLNHRLAKKKACLEYDDEVLAYLVQNYDDRLGARDVRRAIRKNLEPLLAHALFQHTDNEMFKARVLNNELIVDAYLDSKTEL